MSRQAGCLFDIQTEHEKALNLLDSYDAGKITQVQVLTALLEIPSYVAQLAEEEVKLYKKIVKMYKKIVKNGG
jgi:hypothetical protein